MMVRQEGFFKSANGIYNVKYYIGLPETTPRAVVQIVHGMKEHIGRYDEVFEYLCSCGYVVCGCDHIGHGESVNSDEDRIFFAEKDGDKAVISDVGTLHDMMKKKYRTLPYILLGHSFGSFVSRAYAATHKDAIDGLILSGTMGQKMPVAFGKAFCKLLEKIYGSHHRSKLITKITFMGYNKPYKNESNFQYSWLSTDPEATKKCKSDSRYNFDFTVSAYRDMFSIIEYIQSDEWYEDMPKNLPIFIIAGEFDPVSKNTEGLYPMMEKLHDNDVSNIEFKIYEGERHEPLTGLTRQTAFKDVSEWIDEQIEGVIEARRQSINAMSDFMKD